MLIYQIILFVLLVLAITDLTVGVSNDAVNFMNPAIGSRSAKLRIIFILVSIGVLVGATFSSGMMEIARKGIFNPSNFYYHEVMLIFVAVMLTDVLLLDAYNTLGFPTSTTVSLIFELLGAAVAMAIIKIYTQADALNLYEYINTSKAMAIIAGILISIVVAFTVGAIVQWLARLLFSFHYESRMKYFGSIFGGLSIAVIIYFMLIKGMKGASFLTEAHQAWLKANTWNIILYSFVGFSILFQTLYWLFKINVLKIIVLVGTVSLAMAFAGNDLVNFIGVPMAGLSSYEIFSASGASDPMAFTMDGLTKPVHANTYLLLFAGLVMVLSLWLSKKARRVVKTSVDLSRQDEGHERFGSSLMARQIVRFGVSMSQSFGGIVPNSVKKKIDKQFKPRVYADMPVEERPAFDLLRASISLMVASILIALGTSLKLPLSTTYVTFMVAMATSFSDRSWGRESAVYRITGVLSIIGGWFVTALFAFIICAIILVIVYFGGLIAILGLLLLIGFLFVRSSIKSRRSNVDFYEHQVAVSNSFTEETKIKIGELSVSIAESLTDSLRGLCSFKLKKLKKQNKKAREIDTVTEEYKNQIYATLSKTGISFEHSGVFYVQMIDRLRGAAISLKFITEPSFQHVNNNHKELTPAQTDDLQKILGPLEFYFMELNALINKNTFEDIDKLNELHENLIQVIQNVRLNQVKRIRSKNDPTRSSMLIINLLQESQNLLNEMQKMLEAYIGFRNSF